MKQTASQDLFHDADRTLPAYRLGVHAAQCLYNAEAYLRRGCKSRDVKRSDIHYFVLSHRRTLRLQLVDLGIYSLQKESVLDAHMTYISSLLLECEY